MGKSILCLAVLFVLSLSGPVMADMIFTGNLQQRPCQLDTASATQDIVFSTTTLKQFHSAPGRSPVKNFAIKLLNCRGESIGKVVKLVFSGEQEQNLPGGLKVAGVNAGKLAIRIIDTDGQTLLTPGNAHHAGNGDVISGETVTLNFSAYVQVTPMALAERSVVVGDYSAIATFEIIYQ